MTSLKQHTHPHCTPPPPTHTQPITKLATPPPLLRFSSPPPAALSSWPIAGIITNITASSSNTSISLPQGSTSSSHRRSHSSSSPCRCQLGIFSRHSLYRQQQHDCIVWRILDATDGDGGQESHGGDGGGQCVVLRYAAAVNHIHWTLCKGEE